MKNNSRSIKNICMAGAGIWAISLLLLILAFGRKGRVELWAVCVFAIWLLIVAAAVFLLIQSTIDRVLNEMNDSVRSLVDKRPTVYFSVAEESSLGKFQAQLERLYEILMDGREREKKMREQLSSLISDLVHQINTPLANIKIYSRFLADEGLNADDRLKMCEVLDSQVEKLEWFAGGFSKAARLEDDMMAVSPKLQPLLPMILGAIDQISLKAKQNKMEICFTGSQSAEAVFDSRWTQEAMFNLLDNAVKYGDANTPVLVTVEEYDLFARIDVTSFGPVLSKEEYNRLFTRFYRGKNAEMVKEGVGLGLYLTRSIAVREGGYVKAASYGETGNTFSIFLKRRETGECEAYEKNNRTERKLGQPSEEGKEKQ